MKGKIEKISINQIVNYYENPRHAIGSDEKDTLKKLFESVGMQYMLNLAEDIYMNGFLGCQQITLVYSDILKKYVVYEGNRRVACMKLLENPSYFDFLDTATIEKIKKITSTKSKYELVVLDSYITDEEEALFIMERIHSGEDKGRGTKSWLPREKEIFKVRQNKTKTLSYLIDFFIRKYYKDFDITNVLPFTTIQRIFNSREIRKEIGLDALDESTFTKEKMALILATSMWIKEEAERQGLAVTRFLNKTREIEDTVLPWIKKYKDPQKPGYQGTTPEKEGGSDSQVGTEEGTGSGSQAGTKKGTGRGTQAGTEEVARSGTQAGTEEGARSGTQTGTGKSTGEENGTQGGATTGAGSGGTNNLPYFFQGINYGHLNPNDADTHGVTRVCKEVQIFSNRKLVDTFPMAAAFLMRTIIEHSFIYYAKKNKIQAQNKFIWKNISNNEKALTLSKIITNFKTNLSNYIPDGSMRNYFMDLFGDYNRSVDPLNWVVHRPEEYQLPARELIELPRKGLLALINYLIS